MRFILSVLSLLSLIPSGLAQLYIPSNLDINWMVDRLEIKANDLNQIKFHSSVKPYTYLDISYLKNHNIKMTEIDSVNFEYFKNSSFFHNTGSGLNKHPFLKHFYINSGALYAVEKPDFILTVNPVLNFGGAYETGDNAGAKFQENLYTNTRGAEIQGIIDNKISFYTFLTDNQMRVPLQTKLFGNSTYALPGESYFKNFKSNGVDFFHAEAYVAAPLTKNINMQLGSSRQFIGNGMRSLILSDFSKPHLFLKFNTQVWKINYQNLFYELVDSAYTTGSGTYKKKFGATHHLSINISKNFNIGLFETVIFKRENNAYELNYLNPIIFYRAVEHSLGSPDNVILGMDYKWNIKKRMQVYGQIVFDEFLVANMRAQFFKPRSNPQWGWWANKFAAQLGIKAVDLFKIDNLDLQIEYNHIRPYTYGYTNPALNFTDFNQSLAHPLGANLKEIMAVVLYQPVPKLKINFKSFFVFTGIDTSNSINNGSDLLKSSYLKLNNFGNSTGQGLKTVISYYEINLSYRLFQQLYLDAGFTYRMKQTSITSYNNQNQYFSLGLRLNSAARNYMY